MSDQDPTTAIPSARTFSVQCPQCGKEVLTTAHNRKWCSDKCRKQYKREYNAGSITYHEETFDPIMDWKHAEDLADKYTVPVEWVKRGIKYCRESSESPQYFVDRYLEHKDIPMNIEIDRIAREELCQQETV